MAACGATAGAHFPGRPAFAEQVQVKGAGAGFPQQTLRAWGEAAKATTGVRAGYDAVGSNDGIATVVNGEVDFTANATPISANRLRDRHLIQFPSMLGAVAFGTNLPGVAVGDPKLTGNTIADIYLGRTKRWNDPKLAEHNPGLRLRDLAISSAYRNGISGTTLLTSGVERPASHEAKPWKAARRPQSPLDMPSGSRMRRPNRDAKSGSSE